MKDGKLSNYWLVTNRHVVYSKEDSTKKKHLVDSLTFRVRAEEKATQKLIWLEMAMSKAELLQKAKVLPDTSSGIAFHFLPILARSMAKCTAIRLIHAYKDPLPLC